MYSIEHWRMRPDAAGLATQFGKYCRCHIAQAAMGPEMIIIHPPILRKGLRLLAAIPQRFVLGRIFGGLVVCISGFTVI